MPQTILVVDDDVDTQRYLSILLGSQGYEVVRSGEGQEALKLATENPPDLCIVDVMMPGMDGFALTRQLRNHPQTAALPILLFTALNRDEDWKAGLAAGADEYLTKPTKPAELQNAVRRLFDGAPETEGARRAYVVGVVGVKSGLGASTLALNLAAAHAGNDARKVTAVEMQPGASNWRAELDIADAVNLQELFKMPAISTGALNRALNRTAFGLRVLLAGEGEPDAKEGISARYAALIHKLARDADLVVLDIGQPRLPEFPAILEEVDELFVVTDDQETTLENTSHLIDYLRDLGFGSRAPLNVIVNLVLPGAGFDIGNAEALLLHRVGLVIEREDEIVTRARVSSRPAYTIQSDSLLARRVDELNQRITGHMQLRK